MADHAPTEPPHPSVPPDTSPEVVVDAEPRVVKSEPSRPLDWWTRPATRWIALLVATAVIVYLCWLMLAPFIDVVMWAIVLVTVFYPVHRRIHARLRSASWAAAVSCLLVIFIILVPLALVTILIYGDVKEMAENITHMKDTLLSPDPDTTLGRAMEWVDARVVPLDRLRSGAWLSERAKTFSSQLASRTLNVIGGLLGAVVQIFFVIFTMFYLFRDGPKLRIQLRQALPLDRWEAHEIFQRTKDVIHASVYGSVVIASVQGTLGGIMFAILGLPSPVLWGAVMILLSMIPMAGAFIVWGPVALYLVFTGRWIAALVLTAWGALVIGTIDNVLRPRLVGGRTRMHELLIFFSVLGGIQVFGILGIITGPAIAAIAIALFEVWKKARIPAAGSPGPAGSAVGNGGGINGVAASAAAIVDEPKPDIEMHPVAEPERRS